MSLNLRKSLQYRQQGFLMPLAMFIVIGLGALALAISRMGAGTLSAAIQESISVQAFYAADSGVQYTMHKVLFAATNRGQADASCAAVNATSLAFTAASLASCRVTLTCARVGTTGGNNRIYAIESAAICGGGDLLAERTIAAAAVYD